MWYDIENSSILADKENYSMNSDHLIRERDPALYALLCEERRRQESTLDMVASESIQDAVTLALSGSDFANKTVVGLPGHQRLLGSEAIDRLEMLAAERACTLFGADHANMLPYSGTTANLCVMDGLLQPGDTVLALDPEHGSHASHGRAAHISSRLYRFVHFGVDAVTQCIDYDALRKTAEDCRPQMMLIGASSYPRLFDFEQLADIAHNIGAYLVVDMAHTTGLTAAGVIPSPVPYADAVTASCTKTMCGTHTGFILCKDALREKIDRGVYPGVLASMHPATIAAAAWALRRASEPSFRALMQQVLVNTTALADALQQRGLALLTGGTDCHLFVLDLRGRKTDGDALGVILAEMGIWVNSKRIPHDPAPVPMGIRAGCTVLTQRGMKEADMTAIADLFACAVNAGECGYSAADMNEWKAAVSALCTRFPTEYNQTL